MKRSVRHYIDLLTVLTQKEMKVRYKSSFLGYLWSIAHPLALTLVFYLAFKIVMRIELDNYVLFLVCGLFPWQWFANSVNSAPMVFLGNASIIKKVSFPRNLIPFVQVMQDMVHFVLSIPVVLLVIFLQHRTPPLALLYGVPLLLLLQFSLIYGLSLFLSSINLFFRDLERLTSILVLLLFYCTPVFYSEEMVPAEYRFLMVLNPLAPLIVSWRKLFMEGGLDGTYLLLGALYALVAFGMGLLVYRKLSWRFAEVL